MSVPQEIKNFNKLIEPNLLGGKVLNYSTKYLTKPGDNYGSTMLAVTVDVQNPSNPESIEKLEIVAKLPPTNKIYWNLFQPEKTFVKEISCYTIIVPILQKLQRDANVSEKDIIDVFPKCYGSQISLDENSIKADKNAVILLENLTLQGYKVGDRFRGFDFDHAVLILDNLARFHALPIALRILEPKLFESKIRPNLKRFNIEEGLDADIKKQLQASSLADLKKTTEISNEIIEKIAVLCARHKEYMRNPNECEDGLFTTLVHYDFWVNNMLIKTDSAGKPQYLKIVDYQTAQYESGLHDLIFFLFTSLQPQVLYQNFDGLVDFYFCRFVTFLKNLGCDTDEYTVKTFQAELDRLGPIQLGHILKMLKVSNSKTDLLKDFSDVHPDFLMREDSFDENYYNKLRKVILFYVQKGWI